MNDAWYAIQTKPRREEHVFVRLQRHYHLRTFLPKLAVEKWQRTGRVTVIEMLFPSYLFVRMACEPADWNMVRWTSGVKSVVGTGDVPVPVPDDFVGSLMERCMPGDIIPQRHTLVPGTRVRIGQGPFAGLMGVLERLTRREERVRVLLSLLGRATSVEMATTTLEEVC